MFIDTHCHIEKEYYDNIDDVIKENINNGVNIMIVSGCEKKTIDETIEIINKYDCCYATIGYHPDQANFIKETDIDLLKEKIVNKKILGIGEIGLDYHYGKDNKENQIKLFKEQLKIAEDFNLPVVIHSRDAVEDTINILKEYNVKGIIHCFSGSLEVAKIYIKMGFKLGIGGVVTFKNSKLGNVLENIDINDIVLETDSPYLTPEPFRGKTNSSKYIPLIAQKIANIYNIDLETVAKITSNTVFSLFTQLK